MHFGKWVTITFISFGIFIGILVTICARQDISLVSGDYYKEELAYQNQLERMNNTLLLNERPAIEIIDRHFIEIRFNKTSRIEGGRLQLFCPSNSKLDKEFELQLFQTNSKRFDLKNLPGGMYRAKLWWSMNGKKYYTESVIVV